MFIQFLNSLKRDNNVSLVEAIQQGYAACFESLLVKYSATDPVTGEKKAFHRLTEDIPLLYFEPNEALRQIVEAWKNREPSDEQLEFLISQRPIAEVNGEKLAITKHPLWNQFRKFANNIYADRIEKIKSIRQQQGEVDMRNKLRGRISGAKGGKGIIDTNIAKQQQRLHKGRMGRLDKGLKEFTKKELA